MNRTYTAVLATAAGGALAACASTGRLSPGENPHGISVQEHESFAAQEEQTAARHAALYDPKAAESEVMCRSDMVNDDLCWEVETNPTDEHLERAEEHRERAASHRAAAQALMEAEREACEGLPPSAREQGPVTAETMAAAPTYFGEGATIRLKSEAFASADDVEQRIACHRAHLASAGYQGERQSPLDLEEIETDVEEGDGVFVVEITSDEPGVASAVVKRTRSIASQR